MFKVIMTLIDIYTITQHRNRCVILYSFTRKEKRFTKLMKCNIKIDQKQKSVDRRHGKYCYCEHSNGPWVFIKFLEFLDYVNICYYLNIYFAAGIKKVSFTCVSLPHLL
jgi:hypothetical protein